MRPLPDFSGVRVLVAGDVMLDRYWFGDVHRISPEAPVPVVQVQRTEERPGGAANVARNVTALGGRCHLLAVVGEDEAAGLLEKLVRDERIDASLHRDAQFQTTVKLRVIGQQQQLLRIDFERAPSHEVLAAKLDEFERLVGEAQAVVLSDYGKGGLEHVQEMIAIARRRGKPVLVDPKGWDYARYRGATLLTPNRGEFRQVAGQWKDEADLERRAQQLRGELQLDALIVTRSEEGMSLFTAAGAHREHTRAREVFDVSGAGDTVIGVLALMVAAGASLPEAMRVANQAAGIVVGKLGTAVVHREELAASLEASKA
ncbi:MAG TPA: D-glycero-beta-D-manno-heptose-7-phosphate kinase [Usitatibacter sp.]|nr:D-glycero-beta-D-manno-heptose-7-phosphate kinase [Usitatibacter sp.]